MPRIIITLKNEKIPKAQIVLKVQKVYEKISEIEPIIQVRKKIY